MKARYLVLVGGGKVYTATEWVAGASVLKRDERKKTQAFAKHGMAYGWLGST